MIHFSTYSIVGQVPSRNMDMAALYRLDGWIWVVNGGGTDWCKFAEDGDTSYLAQPPTCVFASFVHVARP
jgi:hypothetical protein